MVQDCGGREGWRAVGHNVSQQGGNHDTRANWLHHAAEMGARRKAAMRRLLATAASGGGIAGHAARRAAAAVKGMAGRSAGAKTLARSQRARDHCGKVSSFGACSGVARHACRRVRAAPKKAARKRAARGAPNHVHRAR
ncbi:hypothetical protein FGB62_59g111 [Gracilaria domingensis]|nr:hypothetical protein FGB62_59g111 [Gracilaria domingensis]